MLKLKSDPTSTEFEECWSNEGYGGSYSLAAHAASTTMYHGAGSAGKDTRGTHWRRVSGRPPVTAVHSQTGAVFVKTVRIAAIQMGATKDFGRNLDRAAGLVDEAAESWGQVDVFCLPEYCYGLPASVAGETRSPSLKERILDQMASRAVKHGTNIITGSFPEPAGDGRCYNTTLVIDRQGNFVGQYRKTHLFDALDSQESKTVAQGDELGIFDLDFGRIGIMVCYELRFPEIARTLVLRGAEIIFVPSAFPFGAALPPRTDHWDILTASAAISNLACVVAVNQFGEPGGEKLFGRSAIIDAWGTRLAQPPAGEGVAVGEVDLSYQRRLRERLPVLSHRRPELYPPD